MPNTDLDGLELLDKDELIEIINKMATGGVCLSFYGKRTAQEIQRRVRPRSTRNIKELGFGNPEDRENRIYEGENLQAMVTMYKYKGQIDLIATDPPYNTGEYFRYSDKWENNPNDTDVGTLVTLDDGSRHTKWMKAMIPRLQMMHAMLKPSGVLAICIDDNELFHLGMMLDEIFGEENRIAIINWQKAYSPKNDSKHVSTATEYVLVYAKKKTSAKTGLMPREAAMDSRYWNPDNDPLGVWKKNGDATVATPNDKDRYGIQSPFTGAIHYPGKRSWLYPKTKMKAWLKLWGSEYVEKDIGDGRAKALVINKADIPTIPNNIDFNSFACVESKSVSITKSIVSSRKKATKVLEQQVWPILYFGTDGSGRPSVKRHLNSVKQGKVPITYWADDDYEEPIIIGTQSWNHTESGHSQTGINELDQVLGKGHGFETVKPLKLIKKIIQLWCPPNGLVLDPYAGSGTTGHAILELNAETDAARKFILIEQGNPETSDQYARSLTRERIKRAITGERPATDGSLSVTAQPLWGGFDFLQLTKQIDARAVLSMKREELIDVVLSSHWDEGRRSETSPLVRMEEYQFLSARNIQNEGYFIIWDGPESVGQLDPETYAKMVKEAKKAKLKPPYRVYARFEIYQSRSVIFYKIPDKILVHLGLNEYSERYNEIEEGAER